uniref:Suppressor of forked domain-containing protein n=1 Tax=Aplanochytrium stocchinoi TaxID=215587 RepID=A0A7S3PL53_9STRA
MEQATQDYLSVPIWMKLLEYIFENKRIFGSQKREETVQNALVHAGYDIANGFQVWKFCIEHAESKESKLDLIDQVLRIPLLQVHVEDEGVAEAQKLLKQLEGDEAQRSKIPEREEAMKKARSIARARASLENKIAAFPVESRLPGSGTNDKGLAKLWYEYIQLECSNKSKSDYDEKRVTSVFERAVACCCLSANLWIQYLTFLDFRLKDNRLSLQMHERAVRNCPWSFNLWISYLRALERKVLKEADEPGKTLQLQQSVLTRALSCQFRDAQK